MRTRKGKKQDPIIMQDLPHFSKEKLKCFSINPYLWTKIIYGAGFQEQHFESRGNTIFKMNSKVIFVLVVVILSTLISQGEAFHVGTGGLGKKRELNGCVEVKSILLPYGKECLH